MTSNRLKVAPRQLVRVDQLQLDAELLDGLRDGIADPHDVAHEEVRRDGHVDYLERSRRRAADVTPRRMGVFHDLEAAVEPPACLLDHRANPLLAAG